MWELTRPLFDLHISGEMEAAGWVDVSVEEVASDRRGQRSRGRMPGRAPLPPLRCSWAGRLPLHVCAVLCCGVCRWPFEAPKEGGASRTAAYVKKVRRAVLCCAVRAAPCCAALPSRRMPPLPSPWLLAGAMPCLLRGLHGCLQVAERQSRTKIWLTLQDAALRGGPSCGWAVGRER